MRNLVDSCGWLEFVNSGPNAEFFGPVLRDRDNLVVSSICIYEVSRKMMEKLSRLETSRLVSDMRRAHVVEVSEELAFSAASLSRKYGLGMADAIIFATAQSEGATVWTQDDDFARLPGVKYRKRR